MNGLQRRQQEESRLNESLTNKQLEMANIVRRVNTLNAEFQKQLKIYSEMANKLEVDFMKLVQDVKELKKD